MQKHSQAARVSHRGRRIVEEEQSGARRAEYGKRLIDTLSCSLVGEYGHSYNAKNLRAFRAFYLKFNDFEIWNACVPNLQWTHFRSLLRVNNEVLATEREPRLRTN